MNTSVVGRFRVYPERGIGTSYAGFRRRNDFFIDVLIYKDVRSLQDALGDTKRTGLAVFRGFSSVTSYKSGKPTPVPKLGEIHLPLEHLRVGIISHECTHATLHWARRRRLTRAIAHEAEEDFALVLGNITKQICWKTQKFWEN